MRSRTMEKLNNQTAWETLSSERKQELLPNNVILLGYRGSHAHGMFVPKNDPDSIDDIDLMGVYVAPLKHYFGFGDTDDKGRHTDVKDRFIGEWDVVSYELKKFVKLLVDFNPNVISLLWIDESDYLVKTPAGQRLVNARNIFSSKKAYLTFTGYAHGQFQKMTSFNQEALADIYRREEDLLSRGCVNEDGALKLKGGLMNAGIAEDLRQYNALRSKYFSGYMGEKRRKLVVKYGYDTKNAAHLIRLLRMGTEFLDTGVLNVRRSDSEELLEIKQGKWALEDVKAEAERLFVKAREANESSKLPEKCDEEGAERLCMEILQDHFKERGHAAP
jgi:hypothetical protein